MTGCTIHRSDGIMVMRDSLIKPCPNCGCNPTVFMFEDRTISIRCPGGCTTMGRMDTVKAVTIWNAWANKLKEEHE